MLLVSVVSERHRTEALIYILYRPIDTSITLGCSQLMSKIVWR